MAQTGETDGVVEHAVVIAGGGPTGMVLAAELKLAGIDVVVVERRTTQEVDGSRAGGLHARTLEVLDQRGIVDRFLAEGTVMQVQFYNGVSLDISDFPTRHNYGLALVQRHIERILSAWVEEIGVETIRGREVVGLVQDDDGVDVELSDGSALRAQYLVGCDGGRSVVRKAAGIEFPGLDPSVSWIIAEVDMAEQPEVGVRPEGGGIGPVNPAEPGGPYRVVLKQPPLDEPTEPTLEELSAVLVDLCGTDYGVHSPTWISRFTDMSRQAATYRKGRVLVAGDAAHVHPPMGGQGLNIGVQDAMNLGWKLASVVKGDAPDALLDTYHQERHPVGARVLQNTQAQSALGTGDERHQSLRETVATLLAMDEPRRHIAGMITQLDVHYDLGEGHPLLGRRMPDRDLLTADGPTRAYAFLHEARPVLLDLTGAGRVDLSGWSDRVPFASGTSDGPWELPLLGEVPAPAAVLVRPDGYVAWTGDLDDPSLPEALAAWFGPAAA